MAIDIIFHAIFYLIKILQQVTAVLEFEVLLLHQHRKISELSSSMGRAGWAGRQQHGHVGLGLHSHLHTERLNWAALVPHWAFLLKAGVLYLYS